MQRANLGRLDNGDRRRQPMLAEMEQTLSSTPEQLRALTDARLSQAYAYARKKSPFYGERLASTCDRITGLHDLAQLPFTTKDDLRTAYPFGMLAVPRSQLVRYGESTGTTGGPTSSFMTARDWECGALWVKLSLMNFYDENDTVFIAIPYELSFASMDVDQGFSALGATVVATGTLNSVCPWSRTLQMMHTLHPTVLVCTPSRAGRVWDMFGEQGLDGNDVGLRSLLYIGETCSPSRLRKIAGLWRVSLTSAYGSTETNSLGLFCNHRAMHLLEDRFVFEVLDPNTLEPVPSGRQGELVITTLAHEAMPLIRYRTGDLIEVSSELCGCGLPFRTFHHLGRYTEALRIQGETILRYHLEDTVLGIEGTGHYFVAGVHGDDLVVVFDADSNAAGVQENAERGIAERHGVRARAVVGDRALFGREMDKMLKPGGLSLERLQEAVRH